MTGDEVRRRAVEASCFGNALKETKHPSLRVFSPSAWDDMQWYIARFKRFRKTDSQHGRVWRLYRAKLLTAAIKGDYDPIHL